MSMTKNDRVPTSNFRKKDMILTQVKEQWLSEILCLRKMILTLLTSVISVKV